MPNQPQKGKKLIGYMARKEVRDALDDYCRKNKIRHRSEAIESLLVQALKDRGVAIEEENFEFLPDRK